MPKQISTHGLSNEIIDDASSRRCLRVIAGAAGATRRPVFGNKHSRLVDAIPKGRLHELAAKMKKALTRKPRATAQVAKKFSPLPTRF